MSMIPWLHELRAPDAPSVGGKAAHLGELIAAGFAVPPGFCLTVAAYRAAVARSEPRIAELAARLDRAMPDGALEQAARALQRAVMQARLPNTVLAELGDGHARLGRDAPTVAVRSSAVAEDSAAASFAGQYTTALGVATFAELVDAVKRCWASLWSVPAIRYRWRRDLAPGEVGMAVVVQAMVEPDASGVLFTVDPVTGGDAIVIEASSGRGHAVVDGLVVPDRFVVSRPSARSPAGSPGVRVERSRAPAGGAAPSLSAERAAALARIGCAIEAHFGCPQDVEWALSGGRFAILQARPITAVAGGTPAAVWDSPVPGARWARMSICDSWLPSPLSPLFATTLFPALIEGWLEGWAGSARARTPGPLVPRPMSTTINGYAYLRIDYPLNRHPIEAIKLIVTWLRCYLGAARRWRDDIQPRHIARLRVLQQLALDTASSAEILALVSEAQALSGAYWGVIGGLAWHWNAAEWLLGKLCARAQPAGDRGGARGHGVLLQGFATRATEAELALYALARSSREAGAPQPLGEFLDAYGHQVYQLDLVDPTPAEDPSALVAAMAAYRDGRAADPRERLQSLAARRAAAIAGVDAALRRSPVQRALFHAVLQWAQRTGELRSAALFDFTRAWPMIRRGYLELGRRLARAQAIDAADDVFFLTAAELRDALRSIDAGRGFDCHQLVRERRARWQDQKRLSPPAQVPANTRVLLGPIDITELALLGRRVAANGAGAAIRGSPVSPGRVTAPARTISSVHEFGKLATGDILIAPYITPAWTPLLAIAGGVVTDAGGALSHGSIVAREYGIPAVMGTHHATRQIRDGQIITIDGDRGVVYASPDHADPAGGRR